MIDELKKRMAAARPLPWLMDDQMFPADWELMHYLVGVQGPMLPELVKLAEQAKPKKRIKLYAHTDKDSMYGKGEALGLTGGALSLFAHYNEIELEVDVDEDGKCTLVSAK